MKRILMYVLAGSSLLSCGQEKKKVDSPSPSSIPELYKSVKFRDHNTNYRADISVGACNFTLLVNDVPVAQYFEESGGNFTTTSPINNFILKSGQQSYKLILYPGYSNGKPAKTLSENVTVDITIEGFTYNGSAIREVGTPISLVSLSARQKNFKQAGEPSAVFEGVFNLDVPYDLIGWSESKDLRKEDPAQLLKEILASYKEYSDILTSRDSVRLSNLVYQKEKDYAQALFLDRAGTKKQWDTYRAILNAKKLKIEPLENYQLKFYGNGRLVTLERTDYPFIGQPALRADVTDARGEEYIEYYMNYFHKKQGSDHLELIR
jgi:hypothetical protein